MTRVDAQRVALLLGALDGFLAGAEGGNLAAKFGEARIPCRIFFCKLMVSLNRAEAGAKNRVVAGCIYRQFIGQLIALPIFQHK